MAHDLGRHRSLAAQRPAELADDALGVSIQMDVLAREGGTSAVGAAMSVGLERTDAATQQDALQLLDMPLGGGHGLRDSPSRARLLPVLSGIDQQRCEAY